MTRSMSFILACACMAGVVLMLQACSGKSASNSGGLVEKPLATPVAQASPAASATPVPKLPPPTQAEVESAFQRAFGDCLEISASVRPFFIVGDFNGDDSEDLAVIAHPASGKLQELNSEFSNWIIQDADKALIPVPTKKVVVLHKEERPTVANDEEVLAIIHGFGATGWRNPDARQAYIVKHGAAAFAGTARSVSQKAIRSMHLPSETDIIKELRNNRKGFLFWTGGVYAWHPSEG
jgi:hypothetical protein